MTLSDEIMQEVDGTGPLEKLYTLPFMMACNSEMLEKLVARYHESQVASFFEF